MNQSASTDIFRLSRSLSADQARPLNTLFLSVFESVFGLRNCSTLYREIHHDSGINNFPASVLQKLSVSYRVTAKELAYIPKNGATLLIANHPFGGLEGLILMTVLNQIRPDVKILANYWLAKIPELQNLLIPVNPFNQAHSDSRNLGSLRRAIHWVKSGGALVIFPAGEVSSFKPTVGSISDPPWNSAASRILQRSGATAIPVYFPGYNSLLFQMAGLLHARLRTALLPRELLKKRNSEITLRIGSPITPKRQQDFHSSQQLTDYLRTRTYFLANKSSPKKSGEKAPGQRFQAAIVAPLDPKLLQGEIKQLSETNYLLTSGQFDVFIAESFEIPTLLQEIGRLRELTYRLAGEGTGANSDLDRFDQYYQHLFIWQRESRQVVGAYRLGASDRILPWLGTQGFYTNTLFRYRSRLQERISPGLEMGRAFICPEYQKSYLPLLLLWKGIGRYIARNPHYRFLFGPVSISRDYRDMSRQLITSSLTRHFMNDDLAKLVVPRSPVNLKPLALKGRHKRKDLLFGETMEDISELVAELEDDRKGIPVLMRQYLKLGGKFLAFNLDAQFSDVVDGLILVDLLQTDKKQLVRYLGCDGSEIFLNYQASFEHPVCSVER